MKKIDGKIIDKCDDCQYVYFEPSARTPYCSPLGDAGSPDCSIVEGEIRKDCPLPNTFTDREEMKAMIMEMFTVECCVDIKAGSHGKVPIFHHGIGGTYAKVQKWLLREGMIKPEQCEVL